MSTESVTISSAQLRCGMFVAALDRPWDGTGFLFQGFLVDDAADLARLREICTWVIVDPARSAPDALIELGAAGAPRRRTKPRSEKPRRALPPRRRIVSSPPSLTAAGSTTGTTLAGGDGDLPLLEFLPVAYESPQKKAERAARARAMIERLAQKTEPAAANERPPEVPIDELLVKYRDETTSLAEDLPRATVVAQAAREALSNLARDIVAKGELQLHEVEATANDLTESIVDNPNALVWLVRVKAHDASTYMHGVKVAVYLLTLGRHLGYPPERLAQLAMTGLLLDVGKLFVDAVLLRKNGPLDPAQFAHVQRHVDLGLAALTRAGALPGGVYDGIAQHHERIDGSGYPNGVVGDAITIEGKMAAIADSFAAMTSQRPYAQTMTAYQAMQTLYRLAGTHFQESLVDKFVQAVGIFPTGALVELTSGEVAVVIHHHRQRRLEPRVLVLTYPDKRPLDSPFEIDLMTQEHLSLEHKLARIAQGLPVGAYGLDVARFYVG